MARIDLVSTESNVQIITFISCLILTVALMFVPTFF